MRFSVGLWVGRSATANTMEEVAKQVTSYKNGVGSTPCPPKNGPPSPSAGISSLLMAARNGNERPTHAELGDPGGITSITAPEGLAEAPTLNDLAEKRKRDVIRAALFGEVAPLPRVGRFVIERRLGAGGMGVVYAARDEQLDRPVALKLVRTSGVEHARDRLLREAQALARLTHPNVVTVFEVGLHEGDLYLAMELVAGKTLKAWRTEKPRTPREIIDVYLQAGRGLAAAHAAALVHRDFKPENAMIDDAGRVRVLDFGLARFAEEPASGEDAPPEPAASHSASRSSSPRAPPSITVTGTLMGTPAYMAPEQLRGERAGPSADQFAFCVALFEALCGERPFAGGSLEQIRESIATGRLLTPAAFARVPARVRRALVRGLAVAPEDRWPSMAALIDALAEDPSRASRRVSFALAGVLLAGAAAIGVALRGGKEPRCTEAAARVDEVWGAPQRARMEQTFSQAPQPYVRESWSRVAGALDQYGHAWAEASTEACLAAVNAAPAAGEKAYARVACLERRHEELRAFVEVFGEGGEGVAMLGVEAVLALTPVAACATLDGLGAQPPPPSDPETAARVVELRRDLARAGADDRAGLYERALSRATAVVEKAPALAYRPLLAEALIAQGNEHVSLGRIGEALASFERAHVEALGAGHDSVAADSAREMFLTLGYTLERADAAAPWEKTAEAFVDRLNGQRRLRGAFLNDRALVRTVQGRHPEAESDYRQALSILEEVWGAESLRVATVLSNMVRTADARGDLESAEQFATRALAIREKALGPAHPRVARALTNLGILVLTRGQTGRAVELLRRATGLFESALSPSHPDLGVSLGALGSALLRHGDTEQAVARCERALRILESQKEPAPTDVADVRFTLAKALLARGQPVDRARTVDLASKAAEVYRAGGQGAKTELEELLRWAREHGLEQDVK